MDCTFCGNESTKFMDFGNVALAGAFLKPHEFEQEKKYPLDVYFCEHCYAVEVGEKIEPDILFKRYFYHSSAIPKLNNHFKKYAEYIVERFKPESVIEIGCNDGVMLRHLIGLVKYCVGVDPAGIASEELPVINGYFADAELPQADIIIANNVLAHIKDIKRTIGKIKSKLTDNGVLVFEVHSLLHMVWKNQYDWIYHEHLYYYSLLSLEKLFSSFGMRIFDVDDTGLHAGSRRYFVCKDDRPIQESVYKVRYLEIEERLYDITTFQLFKYNAECQKIQLHSLITNLRAEGKRVVGYGACGRANTMIQWGHLPLEYMIDDAPAKHGYYTPGSHLEIKPEADEDVNYIVVFAWSFLSDIMAKCNTDIIIPLPTVNIIKRQ